jgi:hypothetical protein
MAAIPAINSTRMADVPNHPGFGGRHRSGA